MVYRSLFSKNYYLHKYKCILDWLLFIVQISSPDVSGSLAAAVVPELGELLGGITVPACYPTCLTSEWGLLQREHHGSRGKGCPILSLKSCRIIIRVIIMMIIMFMMMIIVIIFVTLQWLLSRTCHSEAYKETVQKGCHIHARAN